MSSIYRSCYAKHWDPAFSTDRKFSEDCTRSFVDLKRELGAVGEGIELFLEDVQGFDLDGKIEELKALAPTVSLDDLQQGAGSAGQRFGAWLDERSLTSGMREHKNPLTATRLYNLLKIPRIGSKLAPDVQRRLIYIRNMDAAYMLALAETAAYHNEVLLLRDALWKHFDRQTWLNVNFPTNTYSMFQLEFHLNYFTFGTAPAANEADHRAAASNPKWTDLSFLEIETPKAPEGRKHGIFEAHFTLVICGSHEGQWDAYAFDDNEFEGEDLCEKLSACEGFHPDPIASCLPSEHDTDANLPIWNPREYFLKVVANRTAAASEAWDSLIRATARSIKKHRSQHPSTLSQPDGKKRDRSETAKTFDWTRQTKEHVDRLRTDLSETIKYWKDFNDLNGDIDYFTDVNDPPNEFQNRVNPLLCQIKETFQKLERFQRILNGLSVGCKDAENALQLRLTLESSEATTSSRGIADFTTFVLFPIAVAAACLQYSPAMMPLPPGPAVLLLTAVFIVTIKTLHAIFGALPGIAWWWSKIKTPVKAMKLEGVGNPLCIGPLSSPTRKHPNDIDRTALDVEMGPVPG